MLINSSPARVHYRRRGVVLLVVMSMLALFASVALGFVFYADNEANTAELARKAQQKDLPFLDQESLAAYFLNQLIYPTDNMYSAMRGWELSRSIYGYNPATLNPSAYDGIGRDALRYPVPFNTAIMAAAKPKSLPPTFYDNFNFLNYQKFEGPLDPNDPFRSMLRMPEFTGMLMPNGTPEPSYPFRYVGGANPPWTSYDTNSLFLAEVMADGTVLMPSFYRQWLAGPAVGSVGWATAPQWNAAQPYVPGNEVTLLPSANTFVCTTANTNKQPNLNMPAFWILSNSSRYKSMRPDGNWHPGFANQLPDSDTPFGPDVKNLEFGPGMQIPGGGGFYTNDSFWIDLGFPPMTAPNGKRYKPLFAILVMDLSNRLHLWAHGNRIGTNGAHVSNLGLGAPEVNLGQYLGMPPAEYQSLLDYRYGGAGALPAASPTSFRNSLNYSFFAKLDADGLGQVYNSASLGSTMQPFTGFVTTATGAVATGMQTVTVNYTPMTGGFPWAFLAGMQITVDTGAQAETVTVMPAPPPTTTSFTANFTKAHPGNPSVSYAPYFPYRNFPAGWDNANNAGGGQDEVTQKPLGINFFNVPGFTPQAPPPMSLQEVLLRFGGTNAPATTSEIFRRMPNTLGNVKARNMLTLSNWYLDRIAAAPIGFDPRQPMTYRYTGGTNIALANGSLITPGPNVPNSYADITPPVPGSEYGNGGTIAPPPMGASEAGNVVTITTTTPHGMGVGQTVTITGVPLPGYNGTFRITSVPTTTTFTYFNPLAGLTPTGTGAAYSGDWRSVLGNRLRVNINRPLTDYPVLNAFGVIDLSVAATKTQYDQAVLDRQNLARDIYNAMVRVTGAQDPNVVTGMLPTSPDYQAARWLAQLAVNIVDYVDNDDYMTWFQWNTQGAGEIIYGTELPRLVLNEAYGQRENDAKGNGKGKGKGNGQPVTQDVNLWVELHNPFTPTPVGSAYPRDNGIANLVINNNGTYQFPYKMWVSASNAALSTYLRDPSNNLGDMDFASAASANEVSDWVETPVNLTSQSVLPANGAASGPSGGNQGFYVVGPPTANLNGASNPNLPTTHQSAWMSMNLDNAVVANGVTILLRRLANPHLPANPPTPGGVIDPKLVYNPYITVDYLDNIPVADFRLNNGMGMGNNNATPAYGRRHPYSAFNNQAKGGSQVVPQTGGAGNQPANTFFSQNNPADLPFAWLTHLDRPVINTMELRHVSGYRPHELTQQFITWNGNVQQRFQHRTAWTGTSMQQNLLHRALDVLSPPSNMFGAYTGGRVPGNINLNTITEPEVFMALCDPQDAQPNPAFTSANVLPIFGNLVLSRNNNKPGPIPQDEGAPFKPLASGNVRETWLRPAPAGAGALFNVGAAGEHPYRREALLQKIANNITTTSNVFAVWCTVGYFEVVDENTRPVKLGAEIGRTENRHVRHRFFAVVDRSALKMFNTVSTNVVNASINQTMSFNLGSVGTTSGAISNWSNTVPYSVSNTVAYFGVPYYCIQANTNVAPTNPAYWLPLIQPGMLLNVDNGLNAEVVVVKAVAGNSFTADFAKAHAAGVPILCRGNPGPQSNYNPRRDTKVVLHMSVIQ